ncbi:hypothetical protein IMSAG025_01761 [Muribaculaceae bacterium]|nr:hypothetical protein IMSAG025_01761 [Muribaculaceae bacterium]
MAPETIICVGGSNEIAEGQAVKVVFDGNVISFFGHRRFFQHLRAALNTCFLSGTIFRNIRTTHYKAGKQTADEKQFLILFHNPLLINTQNPKFLYKNTIKQLKKQ